MRRTCRGRPPMARRPRGSPKASGTRPGRPKGWPPRLSPGAWPANHGSVPMEGARAGTGHARLPGPAPAASPTPTSSAARMRPMPPLPCTPISRGGPSGRRERRRPMKRPPELQVGRRDKAERALVDGEERARRAATAIAGGDPRQARISRRGAATRRRRAAAASRCASRAARTGLSAARRWTSRRAAARARCGRSVTPPSWPAPPETRSAGWGPCARRWSPPARRARRDALAHR